MVILVALFSVLISPDSVITNGKIPIKPKIIVDAGHGGLTNTID